MATRETLQEMTNDMLVLLQGKVCSMLSKHYANHNRSWFRHIQLQTTPTVVSLAPTLAAIYLCAKQSYVFSLLLIALTATRH